jgi:hypothetical protein
MNRERALILIVLILLTACTPLAMAQSTTLDCPSAAGGIVERG